MKRDGGATDSPLSPRERTLFSDVSEKRKKKEDKTSSKKGTSQLCAGLFQQLNVYRAFCSQLPYPLFQAPGFYLRLTTIQVICSLVVNPLCMSFFYSSYFLPIDGQKKESKVKVRKDRKKKELDRKSSFPSLPVLKLTKQIEVSIHSTHATYTYPVYTCKLYAHTHTHVHLGTGTHTHTHTHAHTHSGLQERTA